MSPAPPPRRRDVVFTFGFDTWGDALRRGLNRPPERLVLTMRDSPRVDRLLVADPFRSAPIRRVRRLVTRAGEPFPGGPRASLVSPGRLARQDPTDVPRLAAVYARYDVALRDAAADRGLDRPVVITTSPFVAGFCEASWAARVVFYGRDDWTELPARAPWWPALRAASREVRRRGRPVVGVSEQVVDRVGTSGPSLVVPNGITPSEWVGAAAPPPPWFADLPGPRAVYVGTLDGRIDVEGLLVLRRRAPWLQVVLLGHLADPDHLRPLSGDAGVHVQPAVSDRAELCAVLRAADVCLVAHRRTRLTEAMSPLKLYEYLAAGAPVLSPAFGPVRDVSPHVVLTRDVAGFADALADGLPPRPTEAERDAFVAENSWARRHEQLMDFALS